MNNYWVVGAYWSGDDQKEKFFKLGLWEMGCGDDEKPIYTRRRELINLNSREIVTIIEQKVRTLQ